MKDEDPSQSTSEDREERVVVSEVVQTIHVKVSWDDTNPTLNVRTEFGRVIWLVLFFGFFFLLGAIGQCSGLTDFYDSPEITLNQKMNEPPSEEMPGLWMLLTKDERASVLRDFPHLSSHGYAVEGYFPSSGWFTQM